MLPSQVKFPVHSMFLQVAPVYHCPRASPPAYSSSRTAPSLLTSVVCCARGTDRHTHKLSEINIIDSLQRYCRHDYNMIFHNCHSAIQDDPITLPWQG